MNGKTWKGASYALIAFVAVLFCTISIAAADEGSSSYQEMLRLSAEGQRLFESGQLAEAAETYARAYESHPQAILLKNQMIARYLLEECEESIELGQAFMATGDASEEDQLDVQVVYAECSLDLAEAAAENNQWAEAQRWLDFGDDFFAEAELLDQAEELRAHVDEEIAGAYVEPGPGPGTDDGGVDGRTIAAWSLTGGGLAIVTAGTAWWIQGHRQFNELNQAREDNDRELFDRLEAENSANISRARWAAPTLVTVGALSTAAGVALLVLSPDDDEPYGARLSPMMGAGTAGAIFSFSF